MLKQTIIGVVGMTALAFFATPSAAWAQAKKYPAPVVAVVDIQAVMSTSEAAKNIKTQIDKLRAGYQQTVQTKNEELRKLEAELQQQRAVLAPDAFQQRQREFDQKIGEAQKDVQDRRTKIELAFEKAMQTVETTVTQIVTQIAKENGITLVLPTQAVIHAEPEMNITPEVLKRLNARLTKVPIEVAK